MKEQKRYTVQMDVYVWAEDDYLARKEAYKIVDKIDEKYPNARPSVTEIGEQPFASFSYRKLDDISKPIPKIKDEPLPF
jgi:hypothetical protein